MGEGKLVLRKLVLDVLKRKEPDVVRFAQRLAALGGVEKVRVVRAETNFNTENVMVVLEGPGLDYEEVEEKVRELGAAVHSIDEVVFA